MSNSSVTLTGNLTSDPEVRYTEGGSGRATFGIAVDRSYKPEGSDEWKNEASFFNVVVWEPLASEAARVLNKGTKVTVTGRLVQRSYEKDGEKKSLIEVVASEIGVSIRSIESMERRVRSANGQSDGAPSKPAAAKRPIPQDEEPF